jgi:tetratricopeptide (TPR) repeat protein
MSEKAEQSPTSPSVTVEDTVDQKIEKAKELKDQGNDFFKQGLFAKARVSYFKALAYTKGLPGRPVNGKKVEPMAQLAASTLSSAPLNNYQITSLDELDVVLKTNIATCYIKLDDGEKAVKFANEALDLKENHWKAFLRRGEGYQLLRFHDKSVVDFDKALTIIGESDENSKNSVLKAKNKTLSMIKAEKEKQKKAYANLFERETYKVGEQPQVKK